MSKGARVMKLHKVEANAVKDELVQQLELGEKARQEKLEQSMAHLQSQLVIARDKYLTVNGYMQARTTLDQVPVGLNDVVDDFAATASELAAQMSAIAGRLAEDLIGMDVNDLDETFMDGLLITDFVQGDFTLEDVVEQLLIVNLLQNIGPVIEGFVQFRESTDQGLATIKAAIAEQDESVLKDQAGKVIAGDEEAPDPSGLPA